MRDKLGVLFSCCASLYLASCGGNLVTQRIRILPVYENLIVSSAIPKFVEREPTEFGLNKYAVPKSWTYESTVYGEKVITWSSKLNSKLKLVILDSGFHPVAVPLEKAAALSNPSDDDGTIRFVRFEGTNTAFTPDAVNLVPINSLPQSIQNRLKTGRTQIGIGSGRN